MAEKLTQEIILQRFKKKIGNEYDYSKVVFTKVNDKVIIICSKHGEFLMRPKAHYDDKRGCPDCDNSGKSGFSINSKWILKPKFVYLIEVINDKEKFLKFGVTVEDEIKTRFQKGQLPYLYNIIFEKYVEDGKKANEIELKIKAKYPKISFEPSKPFRGHTECLEHGIKEHIIKDLQRMFN
ncbi:hypothetical protein V7S78_05350 [Aquirufa regiilacus]